MHLFQNPESYSSSALSFIFLLKITVLWIKVLDRLKKEKKLSGNNGVKSDSILIFAS
jgi:hypothetical protein